ncbi:RNAse P Rpr2/Rpp21/SNM1 subunit domain-containing protein [Cantharellus anzutake]|uniref:RNAse P Rpr2/Rpp21/SNM1 subunit domain-containing protein n=1 Tax=Cantharellus anzutake TaxID=1750568 RepID=UPI00190494EC|nr:RNAse P Rpr2/Rpp21/SNM1 subunit domain-containing protein [Cantharellus anzutake]XP_038913108.1 RNAse P Rpr2/Rpp21/SNM1 subunit domain-containing protein [Cantharellus anzutake]KAF8310059.1 RNAse P Rpr2/Rpp21/SNM1 subunit domain-containing protein [Cantharellus anzutake]KAF8326700.1 RNAse P Rpr2/Rpp21/SNM1 subunit domain-containing protein [Cantharellus anzutake]
MGKKNKNGPQSQTLSIPNKELIQRMSFLYQSTVYLGALSNATPPTSPSKRRSFSNLARNQASILRSIGAKAQIRMDPAVKRSMCKSCNSILIPGSTCSTRIKSSPIHGNRRTTTCLNCHTSRSIPSPPEPRDGKETASSLIGHSEMLKEPIVTDAVSDDELERCRQKLERRKRPTSKRPILSERDVGHIRLRGNEVIP